MTFQDWKWKDVELPEEILARISGRCLVGIYEAALETDPSQLDVLVALGDLYTRQGRFEKGLEIDLRLVQANPGEAMYHYNLACSHSLLGNIDPAFAALERAIELGYDKPDHLREDPDLENLKADGRFQKLLRDLTGKKMRG